MSLIISEDVMILLTQFMVQCLMNCCSVSCRVVALINSVVVVGCINY